MDGCRQVVHIRERHLAAHLELGGASVHEIDDEDIGLSPS